MEASNLEENKNETKVDSLGRSYSTGKRKSNVLWNVVGIRNWQIAKTKESENAPDDGAAKKIVTYQKMGV